MREPAKLFYRGFESHSLLHGQRAELVTAPDCKSGVLRHTGFESLAVHHLNRV